MGGLHYLEWNLFNCGHMENAAADMDGILCHDIPAENDDDGPRYLRAIQEARPLQTPRRRRERGLHPCGVAPLGFRWAGVRGSKNLEVDPRHRATIAEIVRLKDEEKLGWTEISDRLEAQFAAAEGRKPRPMSQRQWDLYHARRCYARYRELLLRRKVNEEWQRRRQGSANEALANGPA